MTYVFDFDCYNLGEPETDADGKPLESESDWTRRKNATNVIVTAESVEAATMRVKELVTREFYVVDTITEVDETTGRLVDR